MRVVCALVGKAKGRVRQSKRLVDMADAGERPRFLGQFDPEELSEDDLNVFDLGPDCRCIQRMTYYKGRVVAFAIMQEIRHEGEWVVVIRADTCHDQAHWHRFAKRKAEQIDRRPLCDLTSIDDVEQGFDDASDLITAQWEENIRRWHGD